MGKKIERPEAVALSSDVLPDKKDLAAARTEAAATLNDAAGAYTFDGDRSVQDHLSGAPEARHLVLGEDDPRDRQLEEQVLTEDVAWTGRIFNVDRLQVKLPDGRMAIRDVVRHPGAVAVVALTEEGQICLVRQYRTALGRVTVEIPAGKLAPGEDPLACAERELKEALLKSITDFLMELGSGFAYMGKVCRLVVGQTEQWLDATPVFHGIADNLNARGGQFCPGFHGTRVMCQEKRPP